MKTIGKTIVTFLMWVIYAVLLRPAMLVGELFVAIMEFIADLIAFPVQFANRMESIEKEEINHERIADNRAGYMHSAPHTPNHDGRDIDTDVSKRNEKGLEE